MSTVIRSELSKKNKYYISKHRYYELKHFCLQYYEWKNKYLEMSCWSNRGGFGEKSGKNLYFGDETGRIGSDLAQISHNIKIIEDSCEEADPYLSSYIFKAVTEDRAFTYLKMVMEIPCGKDYYYGRYRKFFWILDKKRG